VDIKANESLQRGEIWKKGITSWKLNTNCFRAGQGHSTLMALPFGIGQPLEDVPVQRTVMILFSLMFVPSLVLHSILFFVEPLPVPFPFRLSQQLCHSGVTTSHRGMTVGHTNEWGDERFVCA
jgi:hypothetical protein